MISPIVSSTRTPASDPGLVNLACNVIEIAIRDMLGSTVVVDPETPGTTLYSPAEAKRWLMGAEIDSPEDLMWFDIAGVGPFTEAELDVIKLPALLLALRSEVRYVQEVD